MEPETLTDREQKIWDPLVVRDGPKDEGRDVGDLRDSLLEPVSIPNGVNKGKKQKSLVRGRNGWQVQPFDNKIYKTVKQTSKFRSPI